MKLDHIESRWPEKPTVLMEIDTDLSPCFDCDQSDTCSEQSICCQEAYRHAGEMPRRDTGIRDPNKYWYNKLFPENDDD